MRAVRTPRPRALLVLLAATLGTAAGCTRDLNISAVIASVTQGVADQVGLQLASVTCPSEPRPLLLNDTFECTGAVKGGGTLTIAVTQTDTTGIITWTVARTEGLLDLAKVEASIASGLKSQARLEAKVSCGGQWRAASKGDTFECHATGPAGDAVAIGVTVTDEAGNVSWQTK